MASKTDATCVDHHTQGDVQDITITLETHDDSVVLIGTLTAKQTLPLATIRALRSWLNA